MDDSVVTITFGERVENHVGMQMIGEMSEKGVSKEELLEWKKVFEKNFNVEMINLDAPGVPPEVSKDACVLVVRGFLSKRRQRCLGKEMLRLKWDTQAFMRGRVVNKHARYNVCFGEEYQSPDIENGKGTVYDINKLRELEHLRRKVCQYISSSIDEWLAEGNYYYDKTKCYIDYHGDAERKKVIAVRLGDDFPLHYVWYYQTKPVDANVKTIDLHSGDLYIMSEKATGNDWKLRNTYTLRHAAGQPERLQKIKKNLVYNA